MSETRTLLAKISALRQRLEQAQGLVSEARSAAAALLDDPAAPPLHVVRAGAEHDAAMTAAMRAVAGEVERSPRELSARARRVLERGRELLGRLRDLADTFAPEGVPPTSPLIHHYRDTVAMIDTALRTVSLMPDSIAAQMHLCTGLEVTLEDVADRLRTLVAGGERLQREDRQIDRLVGLLVTLEAGQTIDAFELNALAEEVLAEARSGEPMRFLEDETGTLPRFVACHSLTVARVLARVVRHDAELRSRPLDVLLAALLHDVGMLGVPVEVLAGEEPLDVEGRRCIEAHAVAGAQLVTNLLPDAPWLADAVASHHERLDGTGYPDGLKGNRIRPLSRLLAVADVYAAMCADRPHRPARATRTALADTLLLADQGQLDRGCAESLLALSFYPVGSVVEMAHGEVGVVVATPQARADRTSPARPVVALLTDSQGEPMARPCHLDLGETDSHSIVRSLSAAERVELLGRRFPRWAA
jgi:HD-GYP domain-containing protein (c-di-GMP phosphodiesterase class II)